MKIVKHPTKLSEMSYLLIFSSQMIHLTSTLKKNVKNSLFGHFHTEKNQFCVKK